MDYKKEMRKKMKAKRDANQVGKDKMTLKGDYDQDFEKVLIKKYIYIYIII